MMQVCGLDIKLGLLTNCYHVTMCLKMFFGFKRRDSVTQILFDLGLPSFNTIMHNSKVVLVEVFVVAPMLLSDIELYTVGCMQIVS